MPLDPFKSFKPPFYILGYSVQMNVNFPVTPALEVDPELPYLDARGNPTAEPTTEIRAKRKVYNPEHDPADKKSKAEIEEEYTERVENNKPNRVQAFRVLKSGQQVEKKANTNTSIRIDICDSEGKFVQSINKDDTAFSDDTAVGIEQVYSAQVIDWINDLGVDVIGVYEGPK